MRARHRPLRARAQLEEEPPTHRPALARRSGPPLHFRQAGRRTRRRRVAHRPTRRTSPEEATCHRNLELRSTRWGAPCQPTRRRTRPHSPRIRRPAPPSDLPRRQRLPTGVRARRSPSAPVRRDSVRPPTGLRVRRRLQPDTERPAQECPRLVPVFKVHAWVSTTLEGRLLRPCPLAYPPPTLRARMANRLARWSRSACSPWLRTRLRSLELCNLGELSPAAGRLAEMRS
jgi:hypothetical protein